jgi:hypothetical protein
MNRAVADLMLEDFCDVRLHQRIFVPIYAALVGMFHYVIGVDTSMLRLVVVVVLCMCV